MLPIRSKTDGRLCDAPRTALIERYTGRDYDPHGIGLSLVLPPGTEVRQTRFDAQVDRFQALVDGAWVFVAAP